MEQFDLVGRLAEFGVVVFLLAFAVWYMEKRVTKKEDEIKDLRKEKDTEIKNLNNFIHSEAKENLQFLNEVSQVLAKMMDMTASLEGNIVKELKNQIEKLKNELAEKVREWQKM